MLLYRLYRDIIGAEKKESNRTYIMVTVCTSIRRKRLCTAIVKSYTARYKYRDSEPNCVM